MASLLPRSEAPSTVGSSTSTGHDDRIRRRFVRRQWRRRWHLWRWIAAVVLFVGLVVGAIWAVYYSSLLAVSSVEVQGVDLLTPAQVRAAAQVPEGGPLVTVDLAAIDARVTALAPVRSATVTRLWPDQVLIEIKERQVIATVELGGEIRGMDASGILFRSYQRAPRQYPRIRSDQNADSDTLREAGRVLVALPESVSRKVNYVSVESIDRISLVLRDGRVVVWGSSEASADKARVLDKLLAKRARTYDVSVPGLPTYRD